MFLDRWLLRQRVAAQQRIRADRRIDREDHAATTIGARVRAGLIISPVSEAPSPSQSGTEASIHRVELAATLLEQAMQAERSGTLVELVRRRPRAVRWLARRWLPALRGAAGDALADDDLPRAAAWLLQWAVTQLRPDAAPRFDALGEDHWLQLPGWRPFLAMASHLGYVAIPDFPRRYRRRAGEAALDNLCGLWDVQPSTVYRVLERARHSIAALAVSQRPDAPRLLALRQWTAERALAAQSATEDVYRGAWHLRQARRAQAGRDPAAEIWHQAQADDVDGFTRSLLAHAAALASAVETDALLERVCARSLTPRQQVDLGLARAALARARKQADRELRALESARQVAQSAQEPMLLGIVHGALGKYYEPRDAERAFAFYQDSADFLRDLGPETGDVQALEHFVTTHARLAWLYLLRNDPRSGAVLERAETLRKRHRVPDAVLGMLEQVSGEYWRRAGNAQRSLEHRFRALNIFERLGDQRSVLAACLNIGFDLAERGDHARAAEFSNRVLDAARHGGVEAEAVVVAYLNLGASHFWQGDHTGAIRAYERALEESLDAGLKLQAFRARYNLAEAHFERFKQDRNPADEAAGDRYIEAVLNAGPSESSPAGIEAARSLKATVLGHSPSAAPDRLLPGESAAHPDQMSEIDRQRQRLAIPGDPAEHASAHLAIARAYAAIAAHEREAARALIERAGLHERFGEEFAALRRTFERELTREQQLALSWKSHTDDMLDDARRSALIAHLLREGSIGKSGYGEVCKVSPATASKHLVALAERGLLVQRGKGPTTRYELPV
jgi:tetratricopeptide (TPR) repeat protein